MMKSIENSTHAKDVGAVVEGKVSLHDSFVHVDLLLKRAFMLLSVRL
jgi:hypothetical protein